MENVDVAVIGAGIIGLAAASRLASAGRRRTVVVLESAPRYGTETSSRNSEVVHAGIYYPPESLKSRLCHEGRRKLYDLSSDAGIFTRKTGKYIVATNGDEARRLEDIRLRAEAAGAEGLRLVDGAEVRERIPELSVEAALWSPESGIVDSEDLMGHYFHTAQDKGAIFLFKSLVSRIEKSAGGFTVTFGRPPTASGGGTSSCYRSVGQDSEKLEARWIVNAAGLHSDKIAEMAGVDIDEADYRIHWCAGRYFRYKREFRLPHLVYPVPVRHGLGIHLTPDREGRVRLGPDTEFVESVDYDVSEDLAPKFAESVRRYWPDLSDEDLAPDTTGIRPKLTGPDGGFKDFVIREETERGLAGLINLIGIESPGLTASPAIAERVAAMIE